MKQSWKKSLAVAGILAALCAGSAFAADNNDKELPPPPPPMTMNGAKRPALPKLTAEQRTKLDAQRKEIFEKWQTMTPAERRAAHDKFHKVVREEQMKNMTPTEKEKFMKEEAKREKEQTEFREKWAKMTPAQREEYRTKQHEKMLKERTKGMTSAQKEAFLKRDAQIQEERKAFHEKWVKMTPAEKEQWRKDHPRKEGYGMGKGYGSAELHKRVPFGPGPAMPPPENGTAEKAE